MPAAAFDIAAHDGLRFAVRRHAADVVSRATHAATLRIAPAAAATRTASRHICASQPQPRTITCRWCAVTRRTRRAVCHESLAAAAPASTPATLRARCDEER